METSERNTKNKIKITCTPQYPEMTNNILVHVFPVFFVHPPLLHTYTHTSLF